MIRKANQTPNNTTIWRSRLGIKKLVDDSGEDHLLLANIAQRLGMAELAEEQQQAAAALEFTYTAPWANADDEP